MKERSKLTKTYYKNGQQNLDYDKVLGKSADCTKKITQAKNDYINKMTDKLQNPSTAPKTYWVILSRLLYKKKFQQYHHYWLMANLFQIFVKRQIFSIIFFSSICTPIQNTSILPPFYIAQMPE